MASLKEQLDAAGYDVSSFDEASVLKQLDQAGYDVSQFQAEAKPQGFWDKAKGVVGAAMANVPQTTMDIVAKPMQELPGLQDRIAQAGAEALATGVNPGPLGTIYTPQKMNPTAAGLTAGALAYGPELAAGVEGAFSTGKALGPVVSEAMQNLPGVSRLRSLAKILTSPGVKERTIEASKLTEGAKDAVLSSRMAAKQASEVPSSLTGLKGALKKVASEQVKATEAAETRVASAGKAINAAEAPMEAGAPEYVSTSLQNKPKIAENISHWENEFKTKSVDQIAREYDINSLHKTRKLMQAVAESPEFSSQAGYARKLNMQLADAVDQHIPGYRKLLDEFHASKTALESIPDQYKSAAAELRTKIQEASDRFTNSKISANKAVIRAQQDLAKVNRDAEKLIESGRLPDLYRSRAYNLAKILGLGGGGIWAAKKMFRG